MTAAMLAFTVSLASQAAASLPTLDLPLDDRAWVVRIETSGGFTGRGTGHYTVSSAGTVLCVAVAPCPDQIRPDIRLRLSRLVAAVPLANAPAHATPSPPAGTCNDCVTTTMTVRFRTTEGERTQHYTWDITTVKAIPDDVLRLYTAVGAIFGGER